MSLILTQIMRVTARSRGRVELSAIPARGPSDGVADYNGAAMPPQLHMASLVVLLTADDLVPAPWGQFFAADAAVNVSAEQVKPGHVKLRLSRMS